MTDPVSTLRSCAEALRRQDFAAALASAQAGLATAPDHPGLLGITALALLQLGHRDEAIPYLRRQIAVTPQDQAARFNLATLLTATGADDEARALSFDHGGHPGLARLAGYFHQQDGDPAAAAEDYRTAVAAAPQDWESWNNLGNCLAALGESSAAIAAFENAVNRSPYPSLPEVFLNLARALGTVENRDARLRNAEEAARRFPDHAEIRIEHGLALVGMGRNDEAIAVLRAAAADEAGFGEAHVELGLLYEHANRLEALEALISANAEAGASPALDFLTAWLFRRQNRFAEARVLADRIPDTINPVRTAQLRAEIADRLDEPEEAFRQFTAMNRASAAATRATAAQPYRAMVESQTAAMVAPPAVAIAGVVPNPIFVVGFPRSGTTLLDTLLGNLPELQVFEERQMLAQVDSEFPDLVQTTDAAVIVAARARYFALATEFEGAAAGRRIVDKHPLHMARMPLINRLFPEAHIVMVERHPADVVLSCFMANFLLNTAMRSFTDLEEAARTYDAVFANYTRAAELLKLRVHAVRYERMIADLEAEMRPLLAFLGLEWREQVLDNQGSAARRGTVRTASYAQIGQPLYSRAVGRWQRYRSQLEPVMPILDPWIARLNYSN
ncbi:MAG: sulfotransferase [Sphingomonadales bacterium]|nr:sulfotransferase [Sphingomonadales bacterium]